MFDKKRRSQGCRCGSDLSCSMMSMFPGMLRGALVAIGALSVTRFVWSRLKNCNKKKLSRDLNNCKDDVVAFAQDACEEVCDCMSGIGRDLSEENGDN